MRYLLKILSSLSKYHPYFLKFKYRKGDTLLLKVKDSPFWGERPFKVKVRQVVTDTLFFEVKGNLKYRSVGDCDWLDFNRLESIEHFVELTKEQRICKKIKELDDKWEETQRKKGNKK